MNEDPWYAERRARWRPDRVRLLLVAESAPDDGGDPADRRFFYDTRLTGHDGLFREVVRVLYDNPALVSGADAKVPWLARLQRDGVFLIDLATVPVNYHAPGLRASTLAASVQATVASAVALEPNGVVLIKKNVFDLLHEPLTTAGLRVLHHHAVPFPGSGQQKRFREAFAHALDRL